MTLSVNRKVKIFDFRIISVKCKSEFLKYIIEYIIFYRVNARSDSR